MRLGQERWGEPALAAFSGKRRYAKMKSTSVKRSVSLQDNLTAGAIVPWTLSLARVPAADAAPILFQVRADNETSQITPQKAVRSVSLSTEDTSGAQDMGQLLDSVEAMKPLRRGDVIEGVVMRSDSDGVLLNIGHKAEGIVPPGEMRTLQPEDLENLNIGDDVVALVVRGETPEGAAILSIDRAVGEMGWRTLSKALEAGTQVEGEIQGFNRGGAIVEVEGVQGFVPMSQLVSVSRDRIREAREAAERSSEEDSQEKNDGESPVESPEIGKVLALMVLEVNRGRNRAILSERQAIQRERDERKARLIEELDVGEVRRGKVTGISSFGAFVDLGGADGLIHISELSWSTVSSPQEVVRVGDEVDVYVLRVDAENKKIALSLKRLQPEPWETINERHHVGDFVDATVTKLTDFGAFARVEDSVEGLIHISELTSRIINHPREVVGEGDSVRLKILRIEPERRRLGLSLRQAEEELGLSYAQPGGESGLVFAQPEEEPEPSLEQPEEEPEPSLEETEGEPELSVDQPEEEPEPSLEEAEGEPELSIDQPEEEPEPSLEEAEGEPELSIDQPEEEAEPSLEEAEGEPELSVDQPEEEPEPSLEEAEGEPELSVDQPEEEPEPSVEEAEGEPELSVDQAEGEPEPSLEEAEGEPEPGPDQPKDGEEREP